jgi:hypothetical protein
MKLIAATAIALFLFALASAQVQNQQTIEITRSGTPVLLATTKVQSVF